MIELEQLHETLQDAIAPRRTWSVLLKAAFGTLLACIGVTVDAATTGDYRTKASGNWNSTATWETYNGSAWVGASATPTSADGVISIQSGHSVAVTASVTADQIMVLSGGTITSAQNLTLNNAAGTDLDVFGTVSASGAWNLAGGDVVVESGGALDATGSGNDLTVSGNLTVAGGTVTTPSNKGLAGAGSIAISSGTITIGTAGTGGADFKFTGTLHASGGLIQLGHNLNSLPSSWTATGGTFEFLSGSGGGSKVGPAVFYNLLIDSGANVTTLSNSGDLTKVAGNWTNNGTIALTANPNTVEFNGSGTQTIAGSSTTTFYNATVDSGATVNLGVNAAVNTGTFTVSSGGTLNCGTSVLSGTGTFTLASGGTLGIGSTGGIRATAAVGNIQTTTRNYSTGANYIYNGSAAQVTASGLPATVNNLTINNSAGVTLNGSVAPTGTLTISGGDLLLGAANQLGSSTAVSLANGTFDTQGYAQTLAGLTLQSSSTLNLGTSGTAALTFASATRSAGTLTINNWAGPVAQSGTLNRVYITADPGATFLNNVTFTGVGTAAMRLGTGEIVASGPMLVITSVNGGSSPTAGTPFSVVVQAQSNGTPQNATNNTAVTLSLNTGTGSLGGTLSGTILADNNSVTISGVTYTKAESGVVLTATRTSGDSLASGNSSSFSVNPGAANKLAFGQQPSTTTAGSAISPAVRVLVQDANGNTVTSDSSTVSITSSTTGFNGSTLSSSAVNGIATFSAIKPTTQGAANTLTASDGALTGATSSTFTVSAPSGAPSIAQRGSATTANGATVSTLTISAPTGLTAGDVMLAYLTIRGGTLTGFPTCSGWTSVAQVDFEGSGKHHRAELLYKVAGSSEPSSYDFNLDGGSSDDGAAGAIVAFSGVDTTGGTPFDVTPGSFTTGIGTTISGVTAITTAHPNAAVLMFAATFENATPGSFATTSPGSLATLFSNATNGGIGAGWGSKSSAGSTGAGSGSNSVSKNWGAILIALKPYVPQASQLAFTTLPAASTTAGVTFSGVVVQIQDQYGSSVASSGVPITVSLNSGSFAGGSTTTVNTDSSGKATFSNLAITTAASGYVMSASGSGLASATSTTFSITPAAPNKLAFSQQPSTTTAGNAISPALTVIVQDQYGNTCTSDSSSVTIGSSTTAFTGSTLTASASGGVATFSAVKPTTAGNANTLTASDGSLNGTTSSTFTVNPAAASAYRISAATSTPTAGATDVLTIKLVDQYQNPSTYSGDKSLTFSGLSNSPGGAAPTITDKSGSAHTLGTATTITFANGVNSAGGTLIPATPEGPVTLTATDGNFSTGTSGGSGVSLTVLGLLAESASYARPRNVPLKILISDILAHAYNNHSSSISLASVSASTNGATVTIGSSYVLYNRPPGGNVADSFNYTVHDSSYTSQGTIRISPQADATGTNYNQVAQTVDGSNHPVLTFAGVPGYTYLLQYTADLSGTPTWTTLLSTNVTAPGVFRITVANPPGGNVFYRAINQ